MKRNYTQPKEKINLSTIFLGVYFLSLPLDFVPLFSGTSILKLIVLLPMLFTLLRVDSITFKFNKLFIMPLIYYLMVFASSLYSVDQIESISRSITILLNVILLIVCTSVNYNEREMKYLIKMLVYSGWIILLLFLLFGNKDIMEGRITLSINGKFQDPNYLCGYMLFSIIYYIDELMKSKKVINIIYLSIFIIMILSTGSRGGLISVLGAIVFYFLVNSKKKIKSICLLIVVLSILPIAMNFIPEELQSRYTIEFNKNDKGANRFEMWDEIMNNYKEFNVYNKFLGVGAATVRNYNSNANVAHNVWIETLCENGLIGLIALIIFYGVYSVTALKIESKVIIAVFIGYIIMTMSLSLYAYKPIWSLLLLIKILDENKGNLEKISFVNCT